jgi:hypothetical protein
MDHDAIEFSSDTKDNYEEADINEFTILLDNRFSTSRSQNKFTVTGIAEYPWKTQFIKKII